MNLKKAIRITLTEHDFRRLVRGKALTIHSGENPTLEVTIVGMDFSDMRRAIEEAELETTLLQQGKDLGVVLT